MANNTMETDIKRIASILDRKDIDRSIGILEGVCDLVEADSPCVGCDAVTPEPKPPRISTRTIAWTALLVGLCLPPLFPLDEIIGTATAFRGPPMGFHEMELLSPVIHIGEPLIIKTRGQYLRACVWQWVLEWRLASGQPVAIEAHTGSAHVIGEISEHQMAIKLPEGIRPGNYVFHESAVGQCGHGDIGKIIDKDVAFTVID